MSETARTQRTEREDFQATSDPGLLESADRGEVNLLGYEQLYNLWERQQWATQDIDFTQDRIDWHERIPEEERFQRMYGLSSFFIGEQKVAEELGPMMRAAPTEEMRVFLCTQIADEARHVRFFNRFYDEVGVLEATNLQDRLAETSEHVNPEFNQLFDEMLKSRVDHLARQPEDLETLVEAVTLYHMVIEGMLALTGQHFILQYNEEVGTLPGFVEGFNKIARDEHRHVAFGARFLREMAQEDPQVRRRDHAHARPRSAPIADGVLQPKWYVEGETEVLGATMEETRAFAMKALERRLKVIGLAPVVGLSGLRAQNIRPPSGTSEVGPQQDHAALLVGHAEHQHLGPDRADLARREVHDRHDQAALELLARVVGDLRGGACARRSRGRSRARASRPACAPRGTPRRARCARRGCRP